MPHDRTATIYGEAEGSVREQSTTSTTTTTKMSKADFDGQGDLRKCPRSSRFFEHIADDDMPGYGQSVEIMHRLYGVHEMVHPGEDVEVKNCLAAPSAVHTLHETLRDHLDDGVASQRHRDATANGLETCQGPLRGVFLSLNRNLRDILLRRCS